MTIGLNIETKPLTFGEIISCLRNSKFKFFLTGSRCFGGTDEYSDWDFFVDSNKEVEEFLFHLGFSNLNPNIEENMWNNHYEGLSNITILQFNTADNEIVQVQLLEGHDASNIKFAVQKKIKDLGTTFTNLPKSERKKIWSTCLNIAWYYLPVYS